MTERNAQITEALELTSETAEVDFKSELDLSHAGAWPELVKDIVAFANSGGGVIIVGAENDGTPCETDVSALLRLDPADVGNKLYKYAGTHFNDLAITACSKAGTALCAITIGPARIPIVFTNVGSYEASPGRQKTAFSAGSVYFRHGAKSEPGTSDDLRIFLERELEAIRESWLKGIATVVEAPRGAQVVVIQPDTGSNGLSSGSTMRLTDDPEAPACYVASIDRTHPFRQKEVVKEVNSRIAGKGSISSHDVLCVRRLHPIEDDIAFCYTQRFASPRYSQAFVDWLVMMYEGNPAFFDEAKRSKEHMPKGIARRVGGANAEPTTLA